MMMRSPDLSPAKQAFAPTQQNTEAIAQYSTHPIEQLQSVVGNRAVNQLLENQPRLQAKPMFRGLSHELVVQPKLTIGAVGDKYEQEADCVAQQVVDRINVSENPTIQRQEMLEEEEDDGDIQLRMKPIVQRLSEAEGMAATPELETSIAQEKGRGQPLVDTIRQPMERSLGADFSGVKVHTDDRAHQLNRSIQAKAFTTGQDIFFRQGEYNPGSQTGQQLIAHELTHVVQQNGNTLQRQGNSAVSTPNLIQRSIMPLTTLDKAGNIESLRYLRRQVTKYHNARTLAKQKHYLNKIVIASNDLLKKDSIDLKKEIIQELIKQATTELIWLSTSEENNSVKHPYQETIEKQSSKLSSLSEIYKDGIKDPLLLQDKIYNFVAQFVTEIIATVLDYRGLDIDDFAVLMVGSAARRELFPSSDVDLLLLGEKQPDKEMSDAIKEDVDRLLRKIVTTAHEKSGKKVQSQEEKLPFSLDACLSGGLFYTPESAAKVASNSAGGSSDNMVADTTLLNTNSNKALDFHKKFKQKYEEYLDSKNGEMRKGFVPERIKEMKEKVETARKQLNDPSMGFNVKTGLLRPPSLLARDYSTYRGSKDSQLFGIDAEHTLERLETFTSGPQDTQISQKSVQALQEGFLYGVKLRTILHVVTGTETDILPLQTKNEESKTIKQHLDGYDEALKEFDLKSKELELEPRKIKLNKML
jgi:predicted nucleotidyltransferase